jgi:hypothetical protein
MVNRAAIRSDVAFLHKKTDAHSDISRQGRLHMDTTLQGASRTTHLKIVLVSLVAAIIFVTVGINAKIGDGDASSADRGIMKAGQPTAYATQEHMAIR